MIKFIKRLFRGDTEPDVLLVGHDEHLEFAFSRIVAGRRIVVLHGRILVLRADGTVRGSYYYQKWEGV